jgi:hypothetical protein
MPKDCPSRRDGTGPKTYFIGVSFDYASDAKASELPVLVTSRCNKTGEIKYGKPLCLCLFLGVEGEHLDFGKSSENVCYTFTQ